MGASCWAAVFRREIIPSIRVPAKRLVRPRPLILIQLYLIPRLVIGGAQLHPLFLFLSLIFFMSSLVYELNFDPVATNTQIPGPSAN